MSEVLKQVSEALFLWETQVSPSSVSYHQSSYVVYSLLVTWQDQKYGPQPVWTSLGSVSTNSLSIWTVNWWCRDGHRTRTKGPVLSVLVQFSLWSCLVLRTGHRCTTPNPCSHVLQILFPTTQYILVLIYIPSHCCWWSISLVDSTHFPQPVNSVYFPTFSTISSHVYSHTYDHCGDPGQCPLYIAYCTYYFYMLLTLTGPI